MKRSDKIKKHKEVCKKKQEKRNNKENVPPKNTFIVTEAECSDSNSDHEKEIQETEEDRNFIDNDEQVSEDEMWHVNVDLLDENHPNHMSEVDQRLEQLKKVREKNQKKCKHCEGWIKKDDDKHEKNCKYRKVPCFKCKEEIPIVHIKKHIKECKKKKKKQEKKKNAKKKA